MVEISFPFPSIFFSFLSLLFFFATGVSWVLAAHGAATDPGHGQGKKILLVGFGAVMLWGGVWILAISVNAKLI